VTYNTAKHGELKIITCNIPLEHLKYVQKLMDWGIVPSRSEYIRRAVGNQIERDNETKRYVEEVIETTIDNKNFIKIPGYNGNKPVQILRRLEY